MQAAQREEASGQEFGGPALKGKTSLNHKEKGVESWVIAAVVTTKNVTKRLAPRMGRRFISVPSAAPSRLPHLAGLPLNVAARKCRYWSNPSAETGGCPPGGSLCGDITWDGRGALQTFPVFVKPVPTERFLNDGRDNKLHGNVHQQRRWRCPNLKKCGSAS